MSSSAWTPGSRPAASSVPAIKHPRWQHIYFGLAAFNLLTVCASLYLSHRLMVIYAESVRVNHEWSRRLPAAEPENNLVVSAIAFVARFTNRRSFIIPPNLF